MKLISASFFFLVFILNIYPQNYKIVESTVESITIEINYSNAYSVRETSFNGRIFNYIDGIKIEELLRSNGEPELPSINYNISVPPFSNPKIQIIKIDKESYSNKFILPYSDTLVDLSDKNAFKTDIYYSNKYFPEAPIKISHEFNQRYARFLVLNYSPFQFNPVSRSLVFNKKILVKVYFNNSDGNSNGYFTQVSDVLTESAVQFSSINPEQGKNWIGKTENFESANPDQQYWYTAGKDYYKIFLNEPGVYRLTPQQLTAAGAPVNNAPIEKLQVFNEGTEVRLNYRDFNNDGLFNQNDYVEFVGQTVKPTANTKTNVYNNLNVYWFSYQADSAGLRYDTTDGYPVSWTKNFHYSNHTLHFEKDSIFERLGRAPDGNRDYWFWGKAFTNSAFNHRFKAPFGRPENVIVDTNFSAATMRVSLQGMTYLHQNEIFFNYALIGTHNWNGFGNTVVEMPFKWHEVPVFDLNELTVSAIKDNNEEIRINWFEIEYLRSNRSYGDHWHFTSPKNEFGKIRFNVFNWQKPELKIFALEKGELILNAKPLNDPEKSMLFVDNVLYTTNYYCVSEDYFLTPVKIEKDNSASDLRNQANGADYIIITHEDFKSVAEKLANFRAGNLPGYEAPRVKIVEIQDVYDEFSAGLLNPEAVKNFLKYAYDNWQTPAPAYVVLIGDMAWDYRRLYADSRFNYIPSMPYHAMEYGVAASDNNFVTFVGTDLVPDMSIGRISCETVAEGNVLVDKILTYPGDNTKEWKQNVILIGSGMDARDEANLRFNDECLSMDDLYLKPQGIYSTKIFRYPNKPTHVPFYGGPIEIKNAFSNGAVMANYYGHGGGYQWDFSFNSDDIYKLNNGSKLPFITSVTCYTAHFDDMEVFGEQFNSVEGKGSVSFWGSSALTYWSQGKAMTNIFFRTVFTEKNYNTGKAIFTTKTWFSSPDPYTANQAALSTLLGDPALSLALPTAPDFVVKSSDISIYPESPLVNDTVTVKLKIRNLGLSFPNDTISVELKAISADTSYTIGMARVPNFGEADSVIFTWIPDEGSLYSLKAEVNLVSQINELDYTDNDASASFVVYDLGNPNIVKPENGYNTDQNAVQFVFADNGHYLNIDLSYFIQIDTSISFAAPLINSGALSASDGIFKWTTPPLNEGVYYWRTKISNGNDSSNWNETRTFSIIPEKKPGSYFSQGQLKTFSRNNINYSDDLSALILNLAPLPPKPSREKYLSSIFVTLPPGVKQISTITNDSRYIYFGHIYYGNNAPSRIYKIGTGFGGTTRGQIDSVGSNFYNIWHQILYYGDQNNGALYVPTGDAYSLLKVDPVTGDSSRISIPEGMLNAENSKVQNGTFVLSTDQNYVYNLAYRNEYGESRYTIRKFDPKSNWAKVGEDIYLVENAYRNFGSFYIIGKYLMVFQKYSGLMRRINLETGLYELEWETNIPSAGYLSVSYDYENDVVYGGVGEAGLTPKFDIFQGTYVEGAGSFSSPSVGPVSEWNSVNFTVINTGSTGQYEVDLQGLNSNNNTWETVVDNLSGFSEIKDINPVQYKKIRFWGTINDSSFGASAPIHFKDFSIDFSPLPDVALTKNNFIFSPDTILQGLDNNMHMKVLNIGSVEAKDIKLSFYLNPQDSSATDSAYYNALITIPADSSVSVDKVLQTALLSPATEHKFKVIAEYPGREFYTFNNLTEGSFYVSRDSLKPEFTITFDGKEIINGDLISAEPEVVVSLKDNSPLPLQRNYFTLVHNNIPLDFYSEDITFDSTSYPNNSATFTWKPKLKSGKHTLEVLAKDASGNFFDSTSHRTIFYVFDKSDIEYVFNYPNPFKDETHFTFELRGAETPEELKIKVYTIAGRLIRDISIPPSMLQIGFNRFQWDGRDQDGDEIANGVYLYKVICKFKDLTKTITEKLAKVK